VSAGSAVGLVLADLVFLTIVLFAARRGAARVTGATLGLRRTRFWPAVGWATLAYLTMLGVSGLSAIVFGLRRGVERRRPGSQRGGGERSCSCSR
jgi:hypothetical protein